MDERDRELRRVLEAERPVERRVAAADDYAALGTEDVLATHEVVETAPLPLVDAFDLELARLERAVAGGDDECTREETLPRDRRQREDLLAVLTDPLEVGHLLVEMDVGAELQALLDAEVDELLAENLRVAGDVVDVLLGIDRRHLAAELSEALDDADRSVTVAGVVRDGQTHGAGPDDRDITDSVLHGSAVMLPRSGRS